MAARPLVQVYSAEEPDKVVGSVTMPAVLLAPIRSDVVHFVHSNMAKNARQPYAVKKMAGMETSAQSWGTGRAVARIPRVGGGGTHRSGQAAFGNMCRKGRMFAPTKTWRRWHRKINLNQRRYALCSALAATAIPSLVLARGHRVQDIAEIPVVVSDSLQSTLKTANAIKILEGLSAIDDVDHVKDSKKLRAGKGKLRNRRWTQRRGPLVVYDADNGVVKAFRNIPGVELCDVARLNLLQLAPGGHLGRFVIWTQSAFEKLDALYGTQAKPSQLKKDYQMPRPMMTMADLARIINSEEIQSKLKPAQEAAPIVAHRKNPLKNLNLRVKLNPHTKKRIRQQLVAEKKPKVGLDEKAKDKRRKHRRDSRVFGRQMHK